MIAGIRSYRALTTFQKTIFVQLCVWVFFFIGAHAIIIRMKTLGLQPNNHAWMNMNLLAETFILLIAVRYVWSNRVFRRSAYIAMAVFVLCFAAEVIQAGIGVYASYTDTVAGFMHAAFYGVALFVSFSKADLWWRNPDVYICFGIFAYFTCLVPLMSAFSYLLAAFPATIKTLFNLINTTMANMRYLLVAIGFWLARNNQYE